LHDLYYFTVNIIALAHGAAIGWTSPFLPILESNLSPLDDGKITKEESSWIGALLCVGGVIGTFIFGWMADKFGRKISSCAIAFPQLVTR
jgi:MFS family permease